MADGFFLPLFLSRSIFYYLALPTFFVNLVNATHTNGQFQPRKTQQSQANENSRLPRRNTQWKSRPCEVAFHRRLSSHPHARSSSQGNMQQIVLEYRIVPQSEDNIESYSPPCNIRQKLRQRGHESFIHFWAHPALDFNKKLHVQYNFVRFIRTDIRNFANLKINESRFSEKSRVHVCVRRQSDGWFHHNHISCL